jgi:formylmethanofuran dehydrogenase subunit C
MLLLKYRGTTTVPLEAECIAPDRLEEKSATEIARLPIQHGNAAASLGDFFDIHGNCHDREVLIEGDCQRIKSMGAGMKEGVLTIRGPAGMHLGAGMMGGEIHLHGNADDWLGAEMRGGRIHVRGNAGNYVGAVYVGGPVGMRGGAILVEGSAGEEVGRAMRRGLIVIGADAGGWAGAGLIAGSLFVFGSLGPRAGAGMKRGTIAVFGDKPPLLPTFRRAALFSPIFMAIYLRQLQKWGFPVPNDYFRGAYERYCGDLLELGKGELLYWRGRL